MSLVSELIDITIFEIPCDDHLDAIDDLESFIDRYSYMLDLQKMEYQFFMETQPEAWVQRLMLCFDADVDLIIHIVPLMFGAPNPICVEASNICGYVIRLRDSLGMLLNHIQDEYIDNTYRSIIEFNIVDMIQRLA